MPKGQGYPPKKRKEKAAHETAPVKRPTKQPTRAPVKRPVPPPAGAMVRDQLSRLEKKLASAKTQTERQKVRDEIEYFKHHHTIRGKTPRR